MFVGDKECQRDAREAVHCSASNRDTLTGRHNQKIVSQDSVIETYSIRESQGAQKMSRDKQGVRETQ